MNELVQLVIRRRPRPSETRAPTGRSCQTVSNAKRSDYMIKGPFLVAADVQTAATGGTRTVPAKIVPTANPPPLAVIAERGRRSRVPGRTVRTRQQENAGATPCSRRSSPGSPPQFGSPFERSAPLRTACHGSRRRRSSGCSRCVCDRVSRGHSPRRVRGFVPRRQHPPFRARTEPGLEAVHDPIGDAIEGPLESWSEPAGRSDQSKPLGATAMPGKCATNAAAPRATAFSRSISWRRQRFRQCRRPRSPHGVSDRVLTAISL